MFEFDLHTACWSFFAYFTFQHSHWQCLHPVFASVECNSRHNDDWMSSRKRMQSSWLSQRALTYSFTCQRAASTDTVEMHNNHHRHRHHRGQCVRLWFYCVCDHWTWAFTLLAVVFVSPIPLPQHFHSVPLTYDYGFCVVFSSRGWCLGCAVSTNFIFFFFFCFFVVVASKKVHLARAHSTLKYRALARGNKRRFSNPKTED